MNRRKFLTGMATVAAAAAVPLAAAAPADDTALLALIAEARQAWDVASQASEDELDEAGLAAFLNREFNAREDVIRASIARTITGALAKAEFYTWYTEEATSDDPNEWGLASAVRDLKSIVASLEPRP